MSTLAKSRAEKPARVARVGRNVAPVSLAPARRLVPPPGKSAREVMANYPEPSKKFNAEGVERIIACRSDG